MREQNTRLERKFPATCALKIKQRKIEGKDCCRDRKLQIVIFCDTESAVVV
jgi:hypothetical protein